MSSQCIVIYCIYGNIWWRYCDLKCDSHPLVARTATSLWELPHGLPHKANTHTQSPFRWQYVFYFLYFKGLLFTNKINKKKKRSKRFFDKHCLSAYCCKKVYIYLSFSSASSNQPTVPFPPSRGLREWAEQWPCERVYRGPSSSSSSPSPWLHPHPSPLRTSSVNIWKLWSPQPNKTFGSSSLGFLSSFCIHWYSLFFYYYYYLPPKTNKKKRKKKQTNKKEMYKYMCWFVESLYNCYYVSSLVLCRTSPLMPVPVCFVVIGTVKKKST